MTDQLSPDALATLTQATERVLRRYVDEVVIAFNLCPWALPALKQGRVELAVIAANSKGTRDLERVAEAIVQRLADTDAQTELVLLGLPLVACTRLELDDLLRALRVLQKRPLDAELEDAKSDDRQSKTTSVSDYALAAFHPEAPLDTATPERMIPFFRRSPVPMIQAVRSSVLDKIDPSRGSGTSFVDPSSPGFSLESLTKPVESLRKKIARDNAQTLKDISAERFNDAIESITKDAEGTLSQFRSSTSSGSSSS